MLHIVSTPPPPPPAPRAVYPHSRHDLWKGGRKNKRLVCLGAVCIPFNSRDQAYAWAFNPFVLGSATLIPAWKLACCPRSWEPHGAFWVSPTWEIYEGLDFTCNFNQGSLNWAFVSLFNFYPCNLNLISFSNLHPLQHTIPNPSFVLRFSSKV